MLAQLFDPIAHLVIALALLISYVVLRVTGHDEPTLLGLLGGQFGGLGITQVAQRVATAATSSSASSAPPAPPAAPPVLAAPEA